MPWLPLTPATHGHAVPTVVREAAEQLDYLLSGVQTASLRLHFGYMREEAERFRWVRLVYRPSRPGVSAGPSSVYFDLRFGLQPCNGSL